MRKPSFPGLGPGAGILPLLLAGLPFLLLPACGGAPARPGGGVEARQIRTLRELSRKEALLKERIQALPGVEKALVKVRPGRVLVLAAPAGGRGPDPETVRAIESLVREVTGVEGDGLVLRRWGGGRREDR